MKIADREFTDEQARAIARHPDIRALIDQDLTKAEANGEGDGFADAFPKLAEHLAEKQQTFAAVTPDGVLRASAADYWTADRRAKQFGGTVHIEVYDSNGRFVRRQLANTGFRRPQAA